MSDLIKPLKAVSNADTPRAVDEQFKQKDELFEMINNGFKGLFQLAENRASFDVEKINRIVEDKLADQNIITRDDFSSELTDHGVVTSDNIQDEIYNNTDVIDIVADNLEIKRK